MEEKKKVIIIFSCFYEPFMSGAERFVKEVAERLKDNRSFVIITAKLRPDLPQEEDFGGYRVVRIGKGNKWDKIRFIWLAPLEAKKYNPSIIHAVMESYAGIALWLAKYVNKGAKRILTLQSGNLDAQIWSKVPILWSGIHRSPDYITAISTFLADRAKRLGAKNITVVPNGFDFNHMYVGSLGNNHRIICVARLSWEKDHKNLIEAMPKILEKYPDAELILVGDGPLRKQLELLTTHYSLQTNIKFLGNLPHDKAMEVLSRGDVFICPSLAEGLGIVFIEAQASGVPVIGTRVGGIPDVIEDGKTGFLIEPNSSEQIADAIIKVFDMETVEREQMIIRAENSAREKFNWDNIADKVDNIYKKQDSRLRGNDRLGVLIATGIYPPDIGGPATYSQLIEERLKARGHNITVLTYGDENTDAYTVSRHRWVPLRYFSYFLKVLELGRGVDITYVQDSVSVGFPTALANLFLKKKLILKVVGDYAWEQARQVKTKNEKLKSIFLDDFYPFSKGYSFKIDLLYLIQNWVARKADKIITPSFYLKRILRDGWKINPEKIKVIYNSFNIRQQTTDNRQLQDEKFKIISIGRLVSWKGFDTLIEVVKDIPNVELEIVGDGPEFEKLKVKSQKSKVRLLGRLSHGEVIQKMRSSDLFVLNSAYEGLSHVILEAMACGLPVAVSRAGGNIELVGRDEERGGLFEYNNKEQIKEKIIHMVIHRVNHMDKAKKAREFVSGFNEEKTINDLEKLFSIIKSK